MSLNNSGFSIVVAFDQNRGIGKAGGLPWHLPGDLKHFKDITARTPDSQRRNIVIMGRKTWESLPEKFRPLPQRINVVLTRDKTKKFPEGVLSAASLDDALRLVETSIAAQERGEVFVIGGGEIFQQAIGHSSCKKLYLTHIHQSFDCDTFFPPISQSFQEIHHSSPITENGVSYEFADYRRL